jgi:hypothetical protein
LVAEGLDSCRGVEHIAMEGDVALDFADFNPGHFADIASSFKLRNKTVMTFIVAGAFPQLVAETVKGAQAVEVLQPCCCFPGEIANLEEHNSQGGISLVGECVPLSTVGQYAVHQTDPEKVKLVMEMAAPFAGSVLYSTYTNPHPDGNPTAILGFSVPQDTHFGFGTGQTQPLSPQASHGGGSSQPQGVFSIASSCALLPQQMH